MHGTDLSHQAVRDYETCFEHFSCNDYTWTYQSTVTLVIIQWSRSSLWQAVHCVSQIIIAIKKFTKATHMNCIQYMMNLNIVDLLSSRAEARCGHRLKGLYFGMSSLPWIRNRSSAYRDCFLLSTFRKACNASQVISSLVTPRCILSPNSCICFLSSPCM